MLRCALSPDPFPTASALKSSLQEMIRAGCTWLPMQCRANLLGTRVPCNPCGLTRLCAVRTDAREQNWMKWGGGRSESMLVVVFAVDSTVDC